MITYTPIVQHLPSDLQVALLQLVEAVEQNLREQLTPPREEIIDVRAMSNGIIEMQQASQQRMARLENILQQVAEAQQRTEARMGQLTEAQQRTEARMGQLTEAQQRTEARMGQLTEAQQRTEARMGQLTEAQQRTEARMGQLAEAQQRTEARMGQLTEAQQRAEHELAQLASSVTELTNSVRVMQPRLAKADGQLLEQRYIERASSYFGRWLRQIEVLWPGRLNRTLEEALDNKLTPDEKDEVLRLDAILRGKAALPTGADEVYVALEVSVTVNQYDVERAANRAALLRRLGVRVVPVVAGEAIEAEAITAAQSSAVAILRNGRRQGWEQALAAA
ncbi:MAG: hypothetical protein DYG89_36725 [Caldilinea sp. CFX5]|nr:hypothetical protein [Caldilinea sp. CFX5]